MGKPRWVSPNLPEIEGGGGEGVAALGKGFSQNPLLESGYLKTLSMAGPGPIIFFFFFLNVGFTMIRLTFPAEHNRPKER
jgi:hypothetical protein